MAVNTLCALLCLGNTKKCLRALTTLFIYVAHCFTWYNFELLFAKNSGLLISVGSLSNIFVNVFRVRTPSPLVRICSHMGYPLTRTLFMNGLLSVASLIIRIEVNKCLTQFFFVQNCRKNIKVTKFQKKINEIAILWICFVKIQGLYFKASQANSGSKMRSLPFLNSIACQFLRNCCYKLLNWHWATYFR